MKKIICCILIVLVSACANTEKREDVKRSSVNKGTDTAVVRVSLDKKGMPYIDIDPVVIKEGQRIVWAGPTTMEIVIQEGQLLTGDDLSTDDAVINLKTPVLSKKVWLESERYKKFKYDVRVGDVVLDPIIIIRRSF
ncbi:MAG: hypothetical protein K6L81_10095 [Agarilytica sp.]